MEDRVTGADYMAAVRSLPCCAPAAEPNARDIFRCGGSIEPHHAGRRPGIAMKADDSTCIPLCTVHHRQWHDASGVFKHWVKAQRMAWADEQIAETQRIIGQLPDE
jgi:hypothetical protein